MNFSHKSKYFLLVGLFTLLPFQFASATSIGTDVSVSGNLTVAGNSTTTGSGYFGGNVGIGETSPQAQLHVLGTGEQLRLGYDASDFVSFITGVAGALTIGSNGSNPNIVISPSVVVGPAPSPSYTPADTSWVAWVRASDIAGSDGTSLTSVPLSGGTASTFTGSATLRTGANGIGGQNAFQFNGTSDVLTNTTGGGSLTGDFYVAAVVKFNADGLMDVLSWGDSGTNGARRSLIKHVNNDFWFIGENADFNSSVVLTSGTPYFLEAQRSGTQITLWINGTEVATGNPGLVSYVSSALELGQNPSDTEPLNGLLSEAFFLGSAIPSGTQSNLRNYVSSRYGITIANSGTDPILTGATGQGFSAPATLSVNGSLAASAVGAEHELINNWAGQNTLLLWNKNTTGVSAMRFGYYSDGAEMGAIGFTVNQEPWGATTYGSDFIELSNFHDTSQWPIGRIVQTNVADNQSTLRAQMSQNGDVVIYNQRIMSDPLWAALVTIKNSGNVGIGTSSPNALLDVASTSIIIEDANTPSSSSAACTTGTISWDSSYTYVCVATNTWKRSALATW